MHEPATVPTLDLFAPDRAALVDLLAGLTDDEWAGPTACAGWSVKDVALHILGGDLGNLSRRRDGCRTAPTPGQTLVDFINRFNEDWVAAARRLSPPVLIDLLGHVGGQLFAYFTSLDLDAPGGPVGWAGPEPAPVWLDVAREYTERWIHQQQIRDAVGRPGQREPRFMSPVLAAFVRALPRAYRDAAAPNGAAVALRVDGPAGGAWSVVRQAERWRLYEGTADAPAASVALAPDDAWRAFTRGLTPDQARQRARIDGDAALAEPIFHAIAIIA